MTHKASIVALVLVLAFVAPVTVQEEKPKAPAIPEVSSLKIQNAILRANAAMARYQKEMEEQGAIIKGEIAAFEKANPGWTINAEKLVAVEKKAAK